MSAADPHLRLMALSSIKNKRFHCQGGALFAAYGGLRFHQDLVQAIVSLQTISDYLDNLCDRLGVEDEDAFRCLHRSFTDALTPGEGLKDYYRLYPYRDDGGYLGELVQKCQEAVERLPNYRMVEEEILQLASWYCNLQATKHLNPEIRCERLRQWLDAWGREYNPALNWWELAAATGSTLGIFCLLAAAASSEAGLEAMFLKRLQEAYFPWIGAVHILLDYFIDLEEDAVAGDLNFVAYYSNRVEAVERLLLLIRQVQDLTRELPAASFHLTVLQGMLALYLSDPKVAQQGFQEDRSQLLAAGGKGAVRLYHICMALRQAAVV